MNTVSTNDETVAVSRQQLAATVTSGAIVASRPEEGSGGTWTCSREHFQHKTEVLELVQSLLETLKIGDSQKARRTAQTVANILDMYQEDSLLLDPHVPEIAGPLVAAISEQVICSHTNAVNLELCRLPSSLVFILAKVCGYRSMSASGVFPHSFNYLDPLVSLLRDKRDSMPWELQFVLLLWLSVLLLLPFNLSIVLSSTKGGTVQSITALALAALKDCTQSVSKAGALVLGRLLSRDVHLIQDFIEQNSSGECALGILETLNQTLKMLPSRLDDQQLIDKFYVYLTGNSVSPGAEVRAKVLRVRIASKLSLDNQRRSLDFMVSFLGDRDYLVRWAAAKGIGRLGTELEIHSIQTMDTVDVLVRVLNMQGEAKSDALKFQGRSLAVAELIVRSLGRGQILDLAKDQILSQVVALACDGLEHPTTLATWQVRDAASYIIWALARSLVWSLESIETIFNQKLLPALLTVCLFDREISCRRVAAAALQELVGRIGTRNFVSGMPLIETVDFWAVADLRNCFLELTSQVLEIVKPPEESDNLRRHFIEHLLKLKLVHPSDKELRTLAAKTLTKIIQSNHSCFVDTAISDPVLNADVPVTARQGGMEFLTSAIQVWPAQVWQDNYQLQTAVRNVVPRLEKERLYRGKGGEMIRISACRLIEALARNANIAFKQATTDRYLQTVLEGLRHLVAGVQTAAAKALLAITQNRPLESTAIIAKLKGVLVDKNENVAARRGAVLGLAFVAPHFYEVHNCAADVVDVLTTEALAWPHHPLGISDFVDAEARKFAVIGLVRIARTLEKFRHAAISVCQAACEDFQVDQRGDVGSWVREVGINGVICLAPIDENTLKTLVARCCERLDRIRGLAALRLHGLVNRVSVSFEEVERCIFDQNAEPTVDETDPPDIDLFDKSVNLAVKEAVIAAFADPPKDRPELSSAKSAWCSTPCVFRRCTGLLTLPSLQIPVMQSLVNSVGGIAAESVGEVARRELLEGSVDVYGLVRIIFTLLSGVGEPSRVSSRQERNNRFITPVMNSLAFLLRSKSTLLTTLATELGKTIVPKVVDEIMGTRDVHKLRAACSLLVECFQIPEALKALLQNLLNSPFPSIRHSAASGLYLKVIEEDGLHEEVADLLASTDWAPIDDSSERWKEALSELCQLMNVDPPTRESTPFDHTRTRNSTIGKSRQKTREIPAYAELVKDEHW